MSYQVIARKWRPQAFDEVTGQEPITRTLRNAIEFERLHHAYLFSGARGVGKTTTARLLAKALNCHKTEKPNILPCRTDDADQCSSCREIAESRAMDVLEIDAASHTGIDDIRETILAGIDVNPVRDRYKVFIIDEVHQLSKPAFNALLKTLEEPPSNVVFVMATTELHKVPDTILSRCQQFEFRTIPQQKIFERLKIIAEAEKVDVADDALREIARSGEGSMRDAQSNFDQVISFSGEQIAVADVTLALGLASTDMLVRVVSAIAAREARAVLDVVEDLINRGHDLRNYARDLLALFRDLLVFKVSGSAALAEGSALNGEELLALSANFSESDLLRFFNCLAETEIKLKDATQPRFALEIGLVKLVEMGRVKSVEDLLGRLEKLHGNLTNALPQELHKPNAERAAAAAAEKKTLIPDRPPEEWLENPGPLSESEDMPWFAEDEPTTEVDVTVLSPAAPTVDLSFLDSMPIKLPPINPEELEHIEDAWLDTAFEGKLARSGDNLLPLSSAAAIINSIVPVTNPSNGSRSTTNGSGTKGAAIAAEFINRLPEQEQINEAIPVLSPDATDDELMAFAEQHPSVRRALKIFRGKIIEVRRI